jgi:hypothetical protein
VNEAEGLRESWLAASNELGIEVELLATAVLVTEFGSRSGTLCSVCRTDDQKQQLRRDAESRGSFCSVLSDSYLTYDRDLFVETLDDWRWFGDGPPPSWYTGAAWGA